MLINRDLIKQAKKVKYNIVGIVATKFLKLVASVLQATIMARLLVHAFAGTVSSVNLGLPTLMILTAAAVRVALTVPASWPGRARRRYHHSLPVL